jgi:hypothetical protein
MNFDLTAEQQAQAARARAVAAVASESAASIDQSGRLPDGVLKSVEQAALTNVFADGAVSAALVVEEVAGGATSSGGGKPLAGLRGAESAIAHAATATGAALDRARLTIAAAAVGVGRAAVHHAVEIMKKTGITPTGDEQAPHWMVSDAAAEMDAARLLTLSAAQSLDLTNNASAAIALAKQFATTAAERAVEAAIRVVGPDGYQQGSVLERLTRDARTLSLVLGTVEQSRTAAADALGTR